MVIMKDQISDTESRYFQDGAYYTSSVNFFTQVNGTTASATAVVYENGTQITATTDFYYD